MAKEIKIVCDKCKEACPPDTFSSFFYLTMLPVNNEFKKVVREEQYCSKHTEEIRKFIEQMK